MPEVKPQVFIVDDDQGVRESIKILMRSIGVGSETFPSADDFLKAHSPDMSAGKPMADSVLLSRNLIPEQNR